MKRTVRTKPASLPVVSPMIRLSRGIRHISMGVMVFTLALIGINGFAAENDQGLLGNLKIIGPKVWSNSNGVPTQSVGMIIGGVIQVILGFLGIIFLILTLYAGFLWMTAAGDGDKVEKAQKLITSAIVGLIIVVAAQGITYWVLYTVATKIVK